MKPLALMAALALLAACGADGEPIRPTVNTSVSVGSGGVSTSTSVGVQSGPVSVRIGL